MKVLKNSDLAKSHKGSKKKTILPTNVNVKGCDVVQTRINYRMHTRVPGNRQTQNSSELYAVTHVTVPSKTASCAVGEDYMLQYLEVVCARISKCIVQTYP